MEIKPRSPPNMRGHNVRVKTENLQPQRSCEHEYRAESPLNYNRYEAPSGWNLGYRSYGGASRSLFRLHRRSSYDYDEGSFISPSADLLSSIYTGLLNKAIRNRTKHGHSTNKIIEIDGLGRRETRISPPKPRSAPEIRGYKPLRGSGASVDFSQLGPGCESDVFKFMCPRPSDVSSVEDLETRCRMLGLSHAALVNAVMDTNKELSAITFGLVDYLRLGSELLTEGFSKSQKELLDENRATVSDMKAELKNLRRQMENTPKKTISHSTAPSLNQCWPPFNCNHPNQQLAD